ASAPSGATRPSAGWLSGMTHAASVSRGWAAMAKPNSDGSPALMSSHELPPSRERYTPQWFCWYRLSGSPAAMTSLWTHWPVSGQGSGWKQADTPRFRATQLVPPSSVAKVPTALVVIHALLVAFGWGTIVRRFRLPDPGGRAAF